MSLPEPILENLKFFLVEISTLLEKLDSFLNTEDPVIAQRILERSGYTYNLRQRIQSRCIVYAAEETPTEAMQARALSDIAGHLDRLAELSRDCVLQARRLPEGHAVNLTEYRPLLRRVIRSIPVIDEALLSADSRNALKLGRAESKLNRLYQSLLTKQTERLKKQKDTEDLVTGLFIAHSFEQMGDILLTIGESILSGQLGQPTDLQRFSVLEKAMGDYTDARSVSSLDFNAVAETRSGSGISSVALPPQPGSSSRKPQLAIYKDGEQKKLREERDGVESWHRIYPGVAPQILTYKKKGDSAALLIEHLNGVTFDQIVLNATEPQRKQAITALASTLTAIWDNTHRDEPVKAGFIPQLKKRLPSVYELHPSFKEGKTQICGHQLAGFETLLDNAASLEEKLPPPFSVFIHGDFNVDNILYNARKDKINFIDLHRSKYMDYVQDVSVFMVSNFRLQVMDREARRQIFHQITDFYTLMSEFASERNDKTFDARLAIGLARSFVTSTRFILDRNMARSLYLKAHYILRQLSSVDVGNAGQFRLNISEIFSE